MSNNLSSNNYFDVLLKFNEEVDFDIIRKEVCKSVEVINELIDGHTIMHELWDIRDMEDIYMI